MRLFEKWWGVLVGVGLLMPGVGNGQTVSQSDVAAAWSALVPAQKEFSADWKSSLFARGESAELRGDQLKYVGMPIGGFFSGQLYIGGDGHLWHWDIFNDLVRTGERHYKFPLDPAVKRLRQGFAIRVLAAGKNEIRSLDAADFKNVSFRGQYPIATVSYVDPAFPVEVRMEAFSPFIPLDAARSSFPATLLSFSLKNTSSKPIEVELGGWLENGVGAKSLQRYRGQRINTAIVDAKGAFIESKVKAVTSGAGKSDVQRGELTFADFEGDGWDGWKTEGDAFGSGPTHGAPYGNQKLGGIQGSGVANSFALKRDEDTGKLTSKPFRIERRFINFLIGGGRHVREDGSIQTGMNLLVGGKVVRSVSGGDSDTMSVATWDVSSLEGEEAVLEIVDSIKDRWGHIEIDHIVQADESPLVAGPLDEQPDVGSMGLGLVASGEQDRIIASVPPGDLPALFDSAALPSAAKPALEQLVGAIVRKVALQPGETRSATFILTWYFPNLKLPFVFMADQAPTGKEPVGKGRYYSTQFDSARSVFSHLSAQLDELTKATRLWRDTWYDSTLPFWFLDRTLLNISTLASSTVYRFADGRVYGWEGVGSCGGTCTHVWSYEHAMGRLFPELDIALREQVDYQPGVGFDEKSGCIGTRGDMPWRWPAFDGQAGTILRTYRDHQMSADDAFLKRNWPRIKKSTQWLMTYDSNRDGIVEGAQFNTLDAAWHGKIPWITGLYLAALRASEEMARRVNDVEFAEQCRVLAESGKLKFVPEMWNGDYFEQIPDAAKIEEVGSYNGCEIDQVLGQSWAFQVGLGQVLPEVETRKALEAIWKYNVATDVGPFRKKYPAGRWFALSGEGGVLICSWPKGDAMRRGKRFDYYFNESMNGFEHQVASHMIWEGMVTQGLAIERLVHDRYAPSKRNPWNEVECGDHYARSMASYGVFLAACGFSYDGPAGRIGFAPKIGAEHFRAAFVGAQGWGSFEQKVESGRVSARLTVKHGELRLKEIDLAARAKPASVAVEVESRRVNATLMYREGTAAVTLADVMILHAGESVAITLEPK